MMKFLDVLLRNEKVERKPLLELLASEAVCYCMERYSAFLDRLACNCWMIS